MFVFASDPDLYYQHANDVGAYLKRRRAVRTYRLCSIH